MHIKLSSSKSVQLGALLCGCLSLGSALAQALSLDALYQMALDRDPSVKAERASELASYERLVQAQAQRLPQVIFSQERQNNSLDMVGRQDIYLSANRTLLIRQPLYRPLVTDTVVQAAYNYEGALAQRENAERDLLSRLSTVVFEYLYAVEQLDFVRALEQATSTQVKAAEQALLAGSGVRTDIDEARARLDAARVQVLQVRLQIEASRRQVERLVGQTGLRLAPLTVEDPWDTEPALASLSELLAQADLRPQVRILQARLQAARAEVSKAQSGYRPTLDATARWIRSDGENVFNPNGNYRDRQMGMVFNWPLFDGGATMAAEREALARVGEAEQRLQALRDDLAVRVETQFRAVQEGRLRVTALRQALHSAQQALTSSQRSFEAGYRTRLDVLNAEQAFQQARRDLVQGRFGYLLARIQLSALVDNQPTELLARQRWWFKLDADRAPAGSAPIAAAGSGF
jgi:protease secretion system outer membrane protein